MLIFSGGRWMWAGGSAGTFSSWMCWGLADTSQSSAAFLVQDVSEISTCFYLANSEIFIWMNMNSKWEEEQGCQKTQNPASEKSLAVSCSTWQCWIKHVNWEVEMTVSREINDSIDIMRSCLTNAWKPIKTAHCCHALCYCQLKGTLPKDRTLLQ